MTGPQADSSLPQRGSAKRKQPLQSQRLFRIRIEPTGYFSGAGLG